MVNIPIIGIYKITSPNGSIYIGQSIDIELRWKYYKRLSCKEQTKLYNSFKKYGVENHTFEIISVLESYDKNELDRLEVFYIIFFNTFQTNHGLNLKEGGANGKHSEETKEKVRTHNLGKKQSLETRKKRSETYKRNKEEKIANGIYVKVIRSEETRKKQSDSMKGKQSWNKGIPMLEKHKKVLLESNLGIKHSDERIKKTKESIESIKKEKIDNGTYVKVIRSEETRKKLSNSLKGRCPYNKGIKSTEETIKKQSDSKKGKKHSAERIKKSIESKLIIQQERLSMIF